MLYCSVLYYVLCWIVLERIVKFRSGFLFFRCLYKVSCCTGVKFGCVLLTISMVSTAWRGGARDWLGLLDEKSQCECGHREAWMCVMELSMVLSGCTEDDQIVPDHWLHMQVQPI